jgi:hypothetical protein
MTRALSQVKSKAFEESEASLDVTQALNVVVLSFKSAENDDQEKEKRQLYFSPLRKRLVLGTIINRQGSVDRAKADRG